jgi:hypothetical protein
MFSYSQSTGELKRDGQHVGFGYSGSPEGKNNPDRQSESNIGPLPRGLYDIAPPHDTQAHGPFVMALIPHSANQMFGRAGFLIHGDKAAAPGTASHGCIILARTIRELIWNSGDRLLQVIEN